MGIFALRQPGDTSNPLLARPYHSQSTRGLLAYFERDGNRTKGIWLLSQGGRYGCDGIDEVRYNGFVVAETVSDLQWKFHPGTKSTGYNDPLQGRPEFFPTLNFCFSEICYLEVFLPADISPEDPDEPPAGLEVFMRGLKVMHYDLVSGRLEETTPAVSANNGLVGIDLLREVGRIPLTRFQRWAEDWKALEEQCDEEIPWDKGDEIVNIPRFDAHVAFGQSMDPFAAFETVLVRAPGVTWQDVNGGLRPLITPDRDPVHTFIWDPTQTVIRSNIVKRGLSITPRDPAEVPNFFIFTYRDLDDELYKEKFVEIDRPELRDAAGGALNQLGPIPLPGVMRQSLAERIGWYTSRTISGWDIAGAPGEPAIQVYPAQFEVKGKMDSYHVAKGDNVYLAHEILEIREPDPLFCRVLKETKEPKGGVHSFTIQLTARDIYRDTDHSKTQGAYLQPDVSDAPTGIIVYRDADKNVQVSIPPSRRTAGEKYWVDVLAATGVTFTADASTNFLTKIAHGLIDGQEIAVSNTGGALPAPLVKTTRYFVRDKTADTFKLALTVGGAAIDLETNGSGTNMFSEIVRHMPVIPGMFNQAILEEDGTSTETAGSGGWLKTITSTHVNGDPEDGSVVTGPVTAIAGTVRLILGEITEPGAAFEMTWDSFDRLTPWDTVNNSAFSILNAVGAATHSIKLSVDTAHPEYGGSAAPFVELLSTAGFNGASDSTGEFLGTRYRVQISGTEVRVYRNYTGPGSQPVFRTQVPVSYPATIRLTAGQKHEWANVTIGGLPEAVTTYPASDQVIDLGSAPATLRFRVYEERIYNGVALLGDITDFTT